MAGAEAKVMGGRLVVDPIPPRAGVRFGSVRVRKHPMTLGDNPGGTAKGPPLTIDWEHVESEHFSTVDGFLAKYSSSTKGMNLYRLSGQERREIVSAHHSEEDIARAEQEIKMIRLKRQESADEGEEESIKSLIQKKQAERKEKKASSRGFGLFGSFSLGRRRRARGNAS